MDMEQLALKLQETTDRSVRNEGRIKKLEAEQSDLRDLTTSVAVLAQQMENMTKSMDSMVNKVDALETQPGKREAPKASGKWCMSKLIALGVLAVDASATYVVLYLC